MLHKLLCILGIHFKIYEYGMCSSKCYCAVCRKPLGFMDKEKEKIEKEYWEFLNKKEKL